MELVRMERSQWQGGRKLRKLRVEAAEGSGQGRKKRDQRKKRKLTD